MTPQMAESSVKKNIIYNALKTLSSIVFPLITFPYVSRVLQPESIGKINFASSIVGYFSLLATLGITVYAVRECSRVKHDRSALSQLASEIFSLNFCTMILAYALLVLVLLSVEALHGYEVLIFIQSVSIFFTVIGADWLNTAMEDFRYITLRTFVCQLLALLAMFAFVHSPDHYVIYAIIGVVSSSGANIANLFYRRKFASVRLIRNMRWRHHFPSVLLLFSMLIAQAILNNLDITMLGVLKGDYEVGLYATAVKVINIITQVIASVNWVVMPQLSYYFAQKDYDNINRLLHRTLLFTVGLGLPCIAGVNALAPEIIIIIGGDAYMAAVPCMQILAVSMLFSFLSGFYGNIILLPSLREKQFMIACIVSCVFNAVANFYVIPIWGSSGAAMTTVISLFIILLICMINTDSRIKLGNRYEIYSAPIIGSVFIVLIGVCARSYIVNMQLRILAVTFLSVIFYAIVLYFMKHEFLFLILDSIHKRIFK